MSKLPPWPFKLSFFILGLLTGGFLWAQPYPNPHRIVEDWAKLPDGRTMGMVNTFGRFSAAVARMRSKGAMSV